MTEKSSDVVIVGGGMPGLFSALLVSATQPNRNVHLIERGPNLGGLYGSIKDPDLGWLDHGMHVIYETGLDGVDLPIREVLDDSEWIFLEGNRKDIAGSHHLGKLHTSSPYIDLRALSGPFRERALAGLFTALSETRLGPHEACTAAQFFERRFGEPIGSEVIEPILRKLWRRPADELDAMVSRLVLMDRVQLFDAPVMLDLMKSDRLRSRIAFPDQMGLPLEYRSVQRGLYPKRYGMVRVVEAIERVLRARGVRIYTSAQISSLEVCDGRVASLHLESALGKQVIGNIAMLNWSLTLFGLAPLLGVGLPEGEHDAPLGQAHVYLTLREPPAMGGLYYFYAFDTGCHTYRVTDYASYCPDARRPDGSWLVCVELHYEPGTEVDIIEARAHAERELIYFGVIKDNSEILAAKVYPKPGGFPVLTLRNCDLMRELRSRLVAQAPSNLVIRGQAPECGIFFLHEALEQCHQGIVEFEGWM